MEIKFVKSKYIPINSKHQKRKLVKSKHSYNYRILNIKKTREIKTYEILNTYIKSREIKILPADTSKCGGLLKLNMPGVIIS